MILTVSRQTRKRAELADRSHTGRLERAAEIRSRYKAVYLAEDVVREFSLMAKAVVMVLETLPDILERDCGLCHAWCHARKT
jgi:hypothetical protein